MSARPFNPGDPILTEEEIDTLEGVGQLLTRPKGTVFMVEGEESDFVLLIRKGAVKIVMGSARRTVALRRAGETVGEMAPIDRQARSATVVAATEVVVLWISGDLWINFLVHHPRAHMAQTHQANERTKQASRKLVESDFTVERKLAKALLELREFEEGRVNEDMIEVSASQLELAHMAGASLDSIKKAIKIFRAEGLLTTGRQQVTLHDVARLQAIADGQSVAL